MQRRTFLCATRQRCDVRSEHAARWRYCRAPRCAQVLNQTKCNQCSTKIRQPAASARARSMSIEIASDKHELEGSASSDSLNTSRVTVVCVNTCENASRDCDRSEADQIRYLFDCKKENSDESSAIGPTSRMPLCRSLSDGDYLLDLRVPPSLASSTIPSSSAHKEETETNRATV